VDAGHAPRLYGVKELPGGWFLVAMEYISDDTPLCLYERDDSDVIAHVAKWHRDMEELMRRFHREGYVHGDLRAPNILCKDDKVMLVDFDWGGKVGEVSYPGTIEFLSPDLTVGREGKGMVITQADDERVLRNAFSGFLPA